MKLISVAVDKWITGNSDLVNFNWAGFIKKTGDILRQNTGLESYNHQEWSICHSKIRFN